MDKWKFRFLTLVFILLCLFLLQFKVKRPEVDEEKEIIFNLYLKKFNKSYTKGETEYEIRFRTFQEAYDITEKWNRQRESNDSALYGLSQFADISREEFSKIYLRSHKHRHHVHHHHSIRRGRNLVKRTIDDISLPNLVDWRINNAVGLIKDQGLCGACWAFSTLGTIESMAAIKTGFLPSLSVQELIDCAQNGNSGCAGGDPCALIEWLVNNNIKVEPESNYPLKLKNDECKLKLSIDGVEVASNYTCEYLVGKEEKLLRYLANHGPVTVAVNALSWQFYLGGVIQFHCTGDLESLNHAVQIVGYDLTGPIPHYIIRNSWGKHFGENGYVRVAIGGNVCGIASEVVSLDVK